MDKFIIENYYTKGSSQIALELNVSRSSVLKRAKVLGLDTSIKRSKLSLESKTQKECYEKYKKILDISDPDVIYAMGFLWADGHLNISTTSKFLVCSVAYKDKDHFCSLFRDKLNFRCNDYIMKVNHREYKMTKFSLYSKKICNELAGMNFHKKSFVSPIEIHNILSPKKFKIFIVGFFDGDGCFSYKPYRNNVIRFAIDSRCDVEFLYNYLKCHFSMVAYRKGRGNSATLTISRKRDVVKFYNEFLSLYENSLPRKRDIFKKFLEQPKRERKIKKSRPIRFIKNNEIISFNSISSASREMRISKDYIQQRLRDNKPCKGYTVEYVSLA